MNRLQGFQTFRCYFLRKRNITEIFGKLLAISQAEIDKLLHCFADGRIVVFLVQKKPGKRGDRIDLFAFGI